MHRVDSVAVMQLNTTLVLKCGILTSDILTTIVILVLANWIAVYCNGIFLLFYTPVKSFCVVLNVHG